MSTVLVLYAVAAAALFMLWLILSRWANGRGRSPEVQRLRKKGEVLLSDNTALSPTEAAAQLERLLVQNAIVVTRAEYQDATPVLLHRLPAPSREILERYKTILVPESSLELSWALVARQPGQMVRIGRVQETRTDVLMDADTGKVMVGRDAFPSVAHLLVFEAC